MLNSTDESSTSFVGYADKLIVAGVRGAIEVCTRLYWYMCSYIAFSILIIIISWLFNIYGLHYIIYLFILLQIPTSLIFLTRKPVLDFVIRISVLGIAIKEPISINRWIIELAERYCYLISSITYAAVWPLLLLTYIDFSTNPSGYFQILAAIVAIIVAEVATKSEKKRLLNFIVAASPKKLFMQFSLTVTKMLFLNY